MSNNLEPLAFAAELFVEAFDSADTTDELDFLARFWRQRRDKFSDDQNEQIRKAAMRALATVDDTTPEKQHTDEDDVEIGGVMTIEEVEAEEREENNGVRK